MSSWKAATPAFASVSVPRRSWTTFLPDRRGMWIFLTVPMRIPPERTTAPSSRPATVSNGAFRRYVRLNRCCRSPMRNTPTPKRISAPTMNAPSRAGLAMVPREARLHERRHKRVVALPDLFEGALDHDVALVQQRDPVGQRFD